MYTVISDPMPLTAAQNKALLTSVIRELSWSLRGVSRLEAEWHARASAIPDLVLRETALRALDTKRGHADGAALFTVLPRRRSSALLLAAASYQAILDFLDSAHEQAPTELNGRQLHLALVDAVDVERPTSDWYLHHPWKDDGGYLAWLVQSCRAACCLLSSYRTLRPLLLDEARRGQVLALNHLVDAESRSDALRRWATTEGPMDDQLTWFEVTGAASSSLTVHLLLAAAAEPDSQREETLFTHSAYWPWISLGATMLDSYVDAAEDVRNGDHSYVAHYPSMEAAVERIAEIIGRSAANVRGLPNGHRHTVILACMIAMYLSKDSANTAEFRASTRKLIEAGGSLTRVLVPVLRLWRIRYRHQSA